MKSSYNTPILLIGFNRPDTFQRVFEAIRRVEPTELYVAVDGPRKSNADDIIHVAEIKKIVATIDWKCNLHTLFRTENVGCGRGPAEAISWAFETCSELIILEDDCVPTFSFFRFCEEMLDRYRDDYRIWLVSGNNYCKIEESFIDKDYLFSHYAHTHGWATWKRCWLHFDIRMSDFNKFIDCGGADNILQLKEAAKVFNKKYQAIFNNIEYEVTHSWDSQWGYTRLKNNGLGIVPCNHLVHNIGNVGTHFNGTSFVTEITAGELEWPLKHPNFIFAEEHYERKYFKKHLRKLYPPLWYRIVRRIKIILGI